MHPVSVLPYLRAVKVDVNKGPQHPARHAEDYTPVHPHGLRNAKPLCDSEMPLPFLAAVFPQLTHGAEWTLAAKKTPSRVSPWLQPLGVFFVGNIADVSLPSAPGHVCTVTSACWMAAKVQVSEPLPEAYAKDSGNAAWRAAAGQIRRIPCLNVSSCVSLGARSCDSFRKMSICRLYAKKNGGYFYTLVFFIEFPSLSTLRRPLSSLSDPATPPSHSSMMFCVNRDKS